MLLAKINPSATFTSQDGPFAQPTIATAEYLTALARPYIAGAFITHFEVQFGNYIPETTGEQSQPASFSRVQSSQLVLSAEELSQWGLDDTALLEAVALKLGTSVVETIEVEGNYF